MRRFTFPKFFRKKTDSSDQSGSPENYSSKMPGLPAVSSSHSPGSPAMPPVTIRMTGHMNGHHSTEKADEKKNVLKTAVKEERIVEKQEKKVEKEEKIVEKQEKKVERDEERAEKKEAILREKETILREKEAVLKEKQGAKDALEVQAAALTASMRREAESKNAVEVMAGRPGKQTVLDTYQYRSKDIPITITIMRIPGEFVPIYNVSIASISRTTDFILEKIRQELIKHVTLGMLDITDTNKALAIEDKFVHAIELLIEKYFPDADDETKKFLNSYLIGKSLGLGNIDILLSDSEIEEIVINDSAEPVWVYQRKHGWLKTSIYIESEDQIRHYAGIIARKVGRQITVLEPLLDAHLSEGDRVNATLNPISTKGNTITLRKFSRDPWTITRYLQQKTISYDAASLVWTAIQYELSALIAGGTASGKTSTLNCIANFFPPNQRIISIEDTRELQLPKFLHWVPLSTRLPNAEGKGAITMEDLLVNSLRMRPDRILVGEVRRQREAETLFEAIHTGHSCYATFHANSAEETIKRLVNPPINVPEAMLPAISMIMMQFRNRRTGLRRTFQIAEITPEAKANVILQYDAKKDDLIRKAPSKNLMDTLHLYTGFTPNEMKKQMEQKVLVMKYLVKNNVFNVDQVGRIIAEYYTDENNLMKYVRQNKMLS